MRRMALAAGRRMGPLFTLVLGAVLVFTAAVMPARAFVLDDPQDLVVAQGSIVGGPTAMNRSMTGTAATGPYLKLIFPALVAAFDTDLYVVDNAQGLLLRIDTMTQSIVRLAALPPMSGVRLKTGPYGEVYLLRLDRADVTRFSRDGVSLPSFSSDVDILRPADVVITPQLQELWISDSDGRLFSFHPSGRKNDSLTLPGDGAVGSGAMATLLATADRRIVGVDPVCRCIVEMNSKGVVIDRFGGDQLINPQAMALDTHGRTWIIDRGDQRLKIFTEDHLDFSVPAHRLGLTDMTAIAIDHHRAYIADGPGGRIGVYAILPPQRRSR